jgi:hypothetical protein
VRCLSNTIHRIEEVKITLYYLIVDISKIFYLIKTVRSLSLKFHLDFK